MPITGNLLCLFEAKQTFYKMRIGRTYNAVNAEITFTFF
jgi:hypothetical protein